MVANAKFFLFPLPTLAAEKGVLGVRGERVPLSVMGRSSSVNGSTALNLQVFAAKVVKSYSRPLSHSAHEGI